MKRPILFTRKVGYKMLNLQEINKDRNRGQKVENKTRFLYYAACMDGLGEKSQERSKGVQRRHRESSKRGYPLRKGYRKRPSLPYYMARNLLRGRSRGHREKRKRLRRNVNVEEKLFLETSTGILKRPKEDLALALRTRILP